MNQQEPYNNFVYHLKNLLLKSNNNNLYSIWFHS